MRKLARRLTVFFAAGCLGGLMSSIAAWLLGAYGINRALGVLISPDLSAAWLYPRLIWGGLWGFLFLLPLLRSHPLKRGLLLSLGPTLAQLLFVFPYKTPHGLLGLVLGSLTPLWVLVVNAIWGITAAYWIKYVR